MTDSGSNALHLAVRALELPAGLGDRPPVIHVGGVRERDRARWTPTRLRGRRSRNRERRRRHDRSRADRPHARGHDRPLLGEGRGHRCGRQAVGLPVIEDAAHAVDSTLDGRRCGTFGDVAVFSFDAIKNIATPDGGGIASRDAGVMATVRRLRYCGAEASGFDRSSRGGRWWELDWVQPSPDDPERRLGERGARATGAASANQAARKRVGEMYQRGLADVPWLSLPPDAKPGGRHSYFTFLVRVLDGGRDELAHTLLGRGSTRRCATSRCTWCVHSATVSRCRTRNSSRSRDSTCRSIPG